MCLENLNSVQAILHSLGLLKEGKKILKITDLVSLFLLRRTQNIIVINMVFKCVEKKEGTGLPRADSIRFTFPF